jgi:thiamine-phosphate pyrophosphorylase
MNVLFKPGLYAVTPERYPDAERLAREVRLSLEGGAAMVQLRDKSGDASWRRSLAARLRSICDEFRVSLIVNDDASLAADIGAAGVHLGREDGSIADARAVLGPGRIIGVSCYDSLARAQRASEQGADYLAFGSLYPSGTKPGAVRCARQTLTLARDFGLPVVAIGGITPDNGAAVVEAGADALAVIGAVFEAPDVRLAAESFKKLWAQ